MLAGELFNVPRSDIIRMELAGHAGGSAINQRVTIDLCVRQLFETFGTSSEFIVAETKHGKSGHVSDLPNIELFLKD